MNNYIDNHTDSQKSYKKILAYIIKKGKTTRREIQKDTNFSWSSVSSVVSVLLNKNHVIETDTVTSGIGRKTSYIVPNGNKLVCIGVDVNSIGFTCSVVGIDGSTKYFLMRSYENKTRQGIIDLVFGLLDDAMYFVGDKYEVVSIGISCQGDIDQEHSSLKRFVFCEAYSEINFKQIIEEKYGVHTYVEHDTNCVLEDYLYNYCKDKSVCVVRAVTGIGFAICVKGQSIEKFGSIDFGHFVVQPTNGAQCSCGLKGCLEAYASTEGLVKRAGVSDFSVIDNNRDAYREYLDDAGFYLGVTFMNIVKAFFLEEVILTGNVINDDQKLLDKIQETCKEFHKNPVKVTYIKDLSASFGAARLSLINKVELGKGL